MAGTQKALISGGVGKRNTESTMDFLHDLRSRVSGQPEISTDAPYAANARRTAADSICSAAGVSCEPVTSPMRRNVRTATGSQSAVETPSANIAIVRCSCAQSNGSRPSDAAKRKSRPKAALFKLNDARIMRGEVAARSACGDRP
jgi:transposase-like protein